MTEIEYKTCPVCDGKKTWTKTEYEGLRRIQVKVLCTACEGKGKILFVDLTKPIIEEQVNEPVSVTDLPEGWRSSSGWSKTHFINDGKSLCGRIRSTDSILKSRPADTGDSRPLCAICEKKLG